MKNTAENTKIISEFMGIVYVPEDATDYLDWNNLMDVIDKILGLDMVNENMELFYQIRDGIPDKESTVRRIVEFIEGSLKKNELIQMWLDAEEENRKHTGEGVSKCIELKVKFRAEFKKLSKENQSEIEAELDSLAG